jgi:hypothetical protein
MDWKNNGRTGYDLEEFYFEKLNRDLINKIKEKKATGAPQVTETEDAQVIAFRPREERKEKKAA